MRDPSTYRAARRNTQRKTEAGINAWRLGKYFTKKFQAGTKEAPYTVQTVYHESLTASPR